MERIIYFVIFINRPKCDFDSNRNRWNVEYQTTDPNIKIGSMKEEVYLYSCKDTTIHVEGKCKDIITENCENIHIIFEKVISGVEIVHCKYIYIYFIKLFIYLIEKLNFKFYLISPPSLLIKQTNTIYISMKIVCLVIL